MRATNRPTPRRRQAINPARVATPECLALAPLAQAPGDMVRSGWLRNIRSGKRGRPYAVLLLARVVYRYLPAAVLDNNGQFLGWERRFDGDFWVPDWLELADELGCSLRTVREEQRFLETLQLIRTHPIRERIAADGVRAIREAVIPNAAEILAITDMPAIAETAKAAIAETSTAAVAETAKSAIAETAKAAIAETATFPISPPQEAGTETPTEGESAAAAAPTPRRRSAPELLLQHDDPRVQVYIDTCRPAGVTRTNAAIILRRAQDLEIWRYVCEIWRAGGYNANNFDNMFSRYERELAKATAPAPRPPAGSAAPGVTAGQQASAEAIMRAVGGQNGNA